MGDSGEIAAAAYTLGIGHPPGYPLFVQVSKIFSLLPAGDIAFRMNLMVVILAALMLALFYKTSSLALEILNRGRPTAYDNLAAFCISCVLVFSGLFWFEAIHIKGGIYVSAMCIALASACCALEFHKKRETRHFYAGVYLAGFLPVMHHTGILAMIFILSVLLFDAGKKRPGFYIAGAAFFALAFLTPDFYLFIRAKSAEVRWADISTFQNVLSHILRRVYYAGDTPPFTLAAMVIKLKFYLFGIISNYGACAILTVFGAYRLFLTNRRGFILAASFFLFNTATVIVFTSNDPSKLFMETNRVFYLLNDLLPLFLAVYGLAQALSPIMNTRLKAAAAAAVFILPVGLLVNNFTVNNMQRSFLAYDHACNIFKTLDPGDIFFEKMDETVFGMQYLKYVKKSYRDIRAYDSNGNVLDAAYLKSIRKSNRGFERKDEEALELEMAARNPGNVYYYGSTEYPEKGLSARKYGMLYRLMDSGYYLKNAGDLMRICSIRDFYNVDNRKFMERNIIARYFISQAEYAAARADRGGFDFYRQAAITEAGDYANVYKAIASIYFHSFSDVRTCMSYLEKSAGMEPYDFPTLNLIISIYSDLKMWDRALYWYNIYYAREWDPVRSRIIEKNIQYVKNMIRGLTR
jgi:hypothetical protein